MVSIGQFQFGYEMGLYALLCLVPFIIIYLIKPKPKTIEVPSLMFFTKSKGNNRLTNFFRNFITDFLFLIQLLLLLALALSVAKPFTYVQHDIAAANTILVIDASASSQAKEGASTRFRLEIEEAKKLLGKENTIIVAKDVPTIGIQDASAEDAAVYLNSIKPTESGSRLGDAVLLAGELLQGKEGRVIVLSDFISTSGLSVNAAKGVLQSKSITVDYINVASGKKRNVGFVDATIHDDSTTVYVRNYDDKPFSVTLKGPGIEKALAIAANGVEPVPFQTPSGITKLELLGGDDLPADNTFYLSATDKKEIKVLLVTKNASVFLKNALTSSPLVKLDFAEPPIMRSGYDVYIIDNVDYGKILPGTYEDLMAKVGKGASVIINAQETTGSVDFKGLLAIKPEGMGETSPINIEQVNRFTKNMDFSKVSTYIKGKAVDKTITVASASGSPLIAFTSKGAGKIVYYGIIESQSDFKLSPSYPIFWQELLRFLIDKQDIKTMNSKTGNALILDREQLIDGPTGKAKTASMVFEKTGIYTIGDRKIAVNLLNDLESDINPKEVDEQKLEGFELKPVTQTKKFPIELYLLGAACVLLFLEMLYMKIRGDV